jgi:hypothetical protein
MRSKNAQTVQYDGVGEGGLKNDDRQKVVLRRPFFSCSSLSRSTEIARSGSETAETTYFRNTFWDINLSVCVWHVLCNRNEENKGLTWNTILVILSLHVTLLHS